MNAHQRVYLALLILYPRQHRQEYGPAMAQLFGDRLRDEGGGLRTPLVWADIGSDLIKTACLERLETTTMDNLKQNWWLVTAPLLAATFVFLGFGNMVTDDGGEFWGRAVAFGVAVVLAAAVLVGLVLRRRHTAVGALVIGFAVLPGSILVVIFWFPPVALVGLLCLGTSMRAMIDWQRHTRAARRVAV